MIKHYYSIVPPPLPHYLFLWISHKHAQCEFEVLLLWCNPWNFPCIWVAYVSAWNRGGYLFLAPIVQWMWTRAHTLVLQKKMISTAQEERSKFHFWMLYEKRTLKCKHLNLNLFLAFRHLCLRTKRCVQARNKFKFMWFHFKISFLTIFKDEISSFFPCTLHLIL